MLSINYFRGHFGLVCKTIIYHIISHNYKIYQNKTIIFTEKIEINNLLEYNFNYLYKLILNIKNETKIIIEKKIKYL